MIYFLASKMENKDSEKSVKDSAEIDRRSKLEKDLDKYHYLRVLGDNEDVFFDFKKLSEYLLNNDLALITTPGPHNLLISFKNRYMN